MAADTITKPENGDPSVDYTAYPPRPLSQEKPVAAVLTTAQVEMHREVLEHFQSKTFKIPGIENGEPLEEEKFWLAVTGKEFVFGYDTHGRPALYMIPSRQNTEESPRQIQFAFWMLERALDLTGPGVESIVLMINFADRAKNPSFATSKSVLNILQTHYPERLGASLILNMKFNPKPVEDGLFTADELLKEGGWAGSRSFVWDHEKYWQQLVQMCAEIKAKQIARWRKLGGGVGCDEWDYKSEELPAAGAADDAPSKDLGDTPQGAETEVIAPATAI
ncbi:CRAL-TRIO domain-containing protein [Multifurca ochricompacta]|uniref:CRAL-TRIO domain-containing protein n=1 Tax=Multifurca ochricompacta TaxID=376703 RepID=A0AAD4QPW5_9AGAM|nr:CRAL-TRIO domain-containing protein [Multifurca ochricompacta]